MTLEDVEIELNEDLLKLAKLKGINLDQLFQDSIDIVLSLPDDPDELRKRIPEIDRNITNLRFEKKLILDKLEGKNVYKLT
jgi:hypothetical protein